MTRGGQVVRSYATWEQAVAEALRLHQVTGAKFPEPWRYVVRKRRTTWPEGMPRRWNTGRHDRWLVLTNPNVPGRR